jgi:hypothetical protein
MSRKIFTWEELGGKQNSLKIISSDTAGFELYVFYSLGNLPLILNGLLLPGKKGFNEVS